MNSCGHCGDAGAFTIPISMAFQPIVDLRDGSIFAHEALVRGSGGEPAGAVLGLVDEANRYGFDQQCRVKAITLAHEKGLLDTGAKLSINFMPNAVYDPNACIRLTLLTAMRTGLPTDRIVFEFTEGEALDVDHLLKILTAYREMGFLTAIDDFGAGHSGLNLLARFQPDIVKLDMGLIRGIDADPVKRRIVRRVHQMLGDLGIVTVCEGVETAAELDVVGSLGVRFVQGYHLARPAFEALVGREAIARAA